MWRNNRKKKLRLNKKKLSQPGVKLFNPAYFYAISKNKIMKTIEMVNVMTKHLGDNMDIVQEFRVVGRRVYIYSDYTERLCNWMHSNKFKVKTTLFGYLLAEHDDWHDLEVRININVK